MRALLVLTCLLVTGLAGCTAATPEPAPMGQIDGAALGHLLQPHPNATVRLIELHETTRTTERGGFSFYQVPPGYYTLRVDLGDKGRDQEVVAVRADEVTKVILQTHPAEQDDPYSTLLSDSQVVAMAMPGESCQECTWRTDLRQSDPTSVDIFVEWDARHPLFSDLETHLIVRLIDDEGTTLLGPLDHADVVHFEETVMMSAALTDVPHGTDRVRVLIEFDPDNAAPHPDFRVTTSLRLHHGDEDTH